MPKTKTTTIADLKAQSPKEVAKLPPKQRARYYLERYKPQIMDALPRQVNADRMLRVYLNAISAEPKLAECSTVSLIASIMNAAQLGLEINTPTGEAYVIPFKQKAQLIIGYQGMISLARRSGQIVSISARAVCAKDEFRFAYGLHEDLVHVPADGDRGPITHFYAVATLKDGGHAFEVMTVAQVKEVAARSQSRGASGPWKDHFEEMGRKTAIRRLFKYLPKSIEIAEAVDLDERAERGEDQPIPEGLDPAMEIPAAPKRLFGEDAGPERQEEGQGPEQKEATSE